MGDNPADRRRREAPIEMDGDEFRRAGHELVDTVAELLDSLRERKVTRNVTPAELAKLLPDRLPREGGDAAALLRETARLFVDHSLHNGHPRFYGYITASAAPLGALADMLASAVNANLGSWQLSPFASEIERRTVRWIAELLGFPADCGGLFTSGGNVANFTAFLAARRARAPRNLREAGLGACDGRLLVYASEETHTWIQKAADLFGHGTGAVRWLPVDRELRADVSDLPDRIARDRAAGDRPFMVVGTAGTVSTGAIDPLARIADTCREHGLWFHVDGAYGALAAVLPDAPSDLRALCRADSVAVDPHKWLYAPLEAGCTLVRDPAVLADAFGFRPRYYHLGGAEDDRINYYALGLQNSRGFRALKVWLALRQVGRDGYAKMIGDDVRMAGVMADAVERAPECELLTRSLSIVTFRYVPPDLDRAAAAIDAYVDRLNEALLTRLNAEGELFLSNAVVDGRFVLRACVVNFRTDVDDASAVPEIVTRCGRAVHRELGGPHDA
jgi:glutamate/tyrosine decarboxylase-like PLP-dependent enzyme